MSGSTPAATPLQKALRWLGIPVWLLILIAVMWIVLAGLAVMPANRTSLGWIGGYAVVLPILALLLWALPRWVLFVIGGLLALGVIGGSTTGNTPLQILGFLAIFPFACVIPLFLLWFAIHDRPEGGFK